MFIGESIKFGIDEGFQLDVLELEIEIKVFKRRFKFKRGEEKFEGEEEIL